MNSSLLAIAAVTLSTAATAEPVDNLVAKVDAYLDVAYPDAGPGVAAIIVDDGKIIYHGAQGMADIKAGEALSKDSVFRIGSITKQFAAATLMKLVEQCKVSLADPLTKYLPDYPGGDHVTVEMLLNHTSGIKSYTGIQGWMVEANTARAMTTAELIAEFKDETPDFAPGTNWLYNNSGYVLVGAVIEAATGKPWHQVVREEVLNPAGLTGIQYMDAEAATPKMVIGYTDFGGNIIAAQKIVGNVPHAAGALIGDVDSLADWYAGLMAGRIVSTDSLARMIQPTMTPTRGETPYGFGLSLGEERGRKIIGHGGGIFGFTTDSIYFPDEDLFVAVFANSDSPATSASGARRRLAALALGDEIPTFTAQSFDAAAIEPFLGRYQFDDTVRDLFIEDGKLFARREGSPPLEVQSGGNDNYFYDMSTLSWFRLTSTSDGPAMHMYLDGAGEASVGRHIGAIPEEVVATLDEAEMARLVGQYQFPFGTMAIVRDGDALTAQLGGQPAFPLTPRSATEFEVPQVGARLVFTLEGEQAVSLTLFQNGNEIAAPRLAED